jgi:hypothetical protein
MPAFLRLLACSIASSRASGYQLRACGSDTDSTAFLPYVTGGVSIGDVTQKIVGVGDGILAAHGGNQHTALENAAEYSTYPLDEAQDARLVLLITERLYDVKISPKDNPLQARMISSAAVRCVRSADRG